MKSRNDGRPDYITSLLIGLLLAMFALCALTGCSGTIGGIWDDINHWTSPR